MSDLTQLRDHAQMMAQREHAAGCPPIRSRPTKAHVGDTKWCRNQDAHDAHQWTEPSQFSDRTTAWSCAGICGGCLTDAERTFWRDLADDADRLIGQLEESSDEQGAGLW